LQKTGFLSMWDSRRFSALLGCCGEGC